jgi:hypothetical protein
MLFSVAAAVRAAQQDGLVAADMPTAYDWLVPLVR